MDPTEYYIEGAEEAYDQATELPNDTNPADVRASFHVEAVYQPFLSEQQGKRITKNVIFIKEIINLGNLINYFPIYDEVKFEDGKWKVVKFAVQSHIKRHPKEWNAFVKGTTEDVLGTPLSTLFRHDPSKVETYKFYHITTVEHLAACTQAHIDGLGFGARADVEKAKAFLDRSREAMTGGDIAASLQEKDRQIAMLKAQHEDLVKKMTEYMTREREPMTIDVVDSELPKKRGRKPGKFATEDISAEG